MEELLQTAGVWSCVLDESSSVPVFSEDYAAGTS